MGRRLVIIVLFLLAGAVVNVAVAWGLCSTTGQSLPRPGWAPSATLNDSDLLLWSRHANDNWPQLNPSEAHVANSRAFGIRCRSLEQQWGAGSWFWRMPEQRAEKLEHDRRSGTFHVYRIEGGWPLACFGMEISEECTNASLGVPVRRHDGWLLLGRAIPAHWRWPSLAINTLFFAALLWLLVHGPFALRRLIRLRRGLCPKCGYPMGESGSCTECGAALPARAAT